MKKKYNFIYILFFVQLKTLNYFRLIKILKALSYKEIIIEIKIFDINYFNFIIKYYYNIII